MDETSEELPNITIGIDLLGADPISSKKKVEKNSQVARFANLSEDQLQQILAVRHSLGTKKVISYQEASTLAILAANLSFLLQP